MSHTCVMYGVLTDRVLNVEQGMHTKCACGRVGYQSYAFLDGAINGVAVTVSRRWSVYGMHYAEVVRADGQPWYWSKGVAAFGIPDAPVTRITVSV